MPTVSAGSTSSTVLAANSSIAISLSQGTTAFLSVVRAGAPIFGTVVKRSTTYGPFALGDTASITAQGGTVTYTKFTAASGSSSILDAVTPFARMKPIAELTYATFDTRTFQQTFRVPFTGPCMVRAGYLTDDTSTGAVTNTAFAGGVALADENPVDASGAAATWATASATALSAASASLTTDGNFGRGSTGFKAVDVPAASDGLGGGFIVVRTQSSAAVRKMQVSAASANYESHVSALVPSLSYRVMANASGDNCSTAQTGFVNAATGGSAFLNNYHAAAWIDVIPMQGNVVWGSVYGDSTFAGYGTNVSVQPMGYAPIAAMAESFNSSGGNFVFCNNGSAGKGAIYYNRRLRDDLLDASFKPQFVIIQPFTSNDGYTTAAISAGIALAIETASQCDARGIKVFFSTVTSLSASESTSVSAARIAGNAKVLTTGRPVLDLDSILMNASATPPTLVAAYTPDNLHYNITSNALAAEYCKQLVETN